MSEIPSNDAGTRERLLEAAGEMFADKGFEKATIRDIVARANANLNAVNYYFRDKRGLFLAVFEHAHEQASGMNEAAFQRMSALPPADALRAFVGQLLRGFFRKDHGSWPARFMAREIAQPTGALDILVDGFIRPRFNQIVALVQAILGPHVPHFTIQLCAESVVAQCAHVIHARPIVGRLIPQLKYTPEDIEMMADHITRFSLAGLRGVATEGPDT
jgi:AcrR family transcriptional regulator